MDAALLKAAGVGTYPDPDYALLDLNNLASITTNPRIRKLAERYAQNIRKANPGASGDPRDIFNPDRKRNEKDLGLEEVLLGLILISALMDDGGDSNRYIPPGPHPSTIPYADDIHMNNPTEIINEYTALGMF